MYWDQVWKQLLKSTCGLGVLGSKVMRLCGHGQSRSLGTSGTVIPAPATVKFISACRFSPSSHLRQTGPLPSSLFHLISIIFLISLKDKNNFIISVEMINMH